MPHKIRVTTETYDFSRDASVEYMDIPVGWETWTRAQRDEFLIDVASPAIALRAGGGACVVDENDEEVEEA